MIDGKTNGSYTSILSRKLIQIDMDMFIIIMT